MTRHMDDGPRRDPRFAQVYRAESVRMRRPASEPEPQNEPKPQSEPEPQPPMRDAAVILPLLLLLMTEGADRYLLLSLLYILM